MSSRIQRELRRLRETLSRQNATEAFQREFERRPDSDAELEKFIDDYVREAFADGVENWDDLEKSKATVYRRSMDTPIGRKLKGAGFSSLWSYFQQHPSIDLQSFGADLKLSTLAPIGFASFIVEVAREDGNWIDAFRALLTYHLNCIYTKSTPLPGKDMWLTVLPIARLAGDFPAEIKWVNSATQTVIKHLVDHPEDLNRPWTWDDPWITTIVSEETGRSSHSKADR